MNKWEINPTNIGTVSILVSVLMAVTAQSAKKTQQQILCEKLSDRAMDICADQMCEQWADENGTDKSECIKDGDFFEGLHSSDCIEEELTVLVRKYNKKHKSNLTCEE